MGKPLNKRLVAAYAKAFKQFLVLRERGFSIMVHSDSLSMCSQKFCGYIDLATQIYIIIYIHNYTYIYIYIYIYIYRVIVL